VLNEAKNAGDAIASARLFNEVQCKICRLQPFDGPPNKSITLPRLAAFVLQTYSDSPFRLLTVQRCSLFQGFVSTFSLITGTFNPMQKIQTTHFQ